MNGPFLPNRGPLKALLALAGLVGLGLCWRGSWSPVPPSPTGPGARGAPGGTTAPSAAKSRARPEIILSQAGPSIFPKSWHTRKIDATAKPLAAGEAARSRRILERATAKYPESFLALNLRRIYVLGDLGFSQVSASGTNSLEDVYLVNQGAANNFTDRWIEKVFHAEFSSIILRNYSDSFDFDAWAQANPSGFQYEGDGVAAIRKNRFSKHFDTTLHPEGFLCEYALSDLENDFNCIAEQLFLGDHAFWQVINSNPRLKIKTSLAISFYARIHPDFSRKIFEVFTLTTSSGSD